MTNRFLKPISKMDSDLNNIKFVEVFIQFVRIGEIDTMNEKYQAEVNIESRWITNEQLNGKYDPNLHWNPKIYIENAFQEPKEAIKYEVGKDSLNLNNYVVIEKRNVKGISKFIYYKFKFFFGQNFIVSY